MQIESNAFKLLKNSKSFNEIIFSGTILSDPKSNIQDNEKNLFNNQQDEKLEQEVSKRFNYNNYYQIAAFNLKNEINKEKCLESFFKEKFRHESNDLNENQLKEILNNNKTKWKDKELGCNSNNTISAKSSSNNVNFKAIV